MDIQPQERPQVPTKEENSSNGYLKTLDSRRNTASH